MPPSPTPPGGRSTSTSCPGPTRSGARRRPAPSTWRRTPPTSTSTSWWTPACSPLSSGGSTGRTGPGAGRPAKLYRRADRQWSVSLPDRHYDLVGDILASGIERARTTGGPLEDAIDQAASETGRAIGTAAAPGDLERFTEVLAGQGFEPRLEDDDTVLLANCPFDALAQNHTALVCGLNRSFVQGVADGIGCAGVTAHLEPEPGQCCVKARRAG